jgi:hypothetical protein
MRARDLEELWNVTRALCFLKVHPIIPTTILLAPRFVPPADLILYTNLDGPKASPTWLEASISERSKCFLPALCYFSLDAFAMFHRLTNYSLHFLNEYSIIPNTGTARIPLNTLLKDSEELVVITSYRSLRYQMQEPTCPFEASDPKANSLPLH